MSPQLKAALLRTATEIADSKKWMGAILAGVIYILLRVAGKLQLGLSPDEAREIAQQVIYLALVAVGGQALADHGAQGASKSTSPVAILGEVAVGAMLQQGASAIAAPIIVTDAAPSAPSPAPPSSSSPSQGVQGTESPAAAKPVSPPTSVMS